MKIIKPGKKEEFTLHGDCSDCDCVFTAEITECSFKMAPYSQKDLRAQIRCPNCQAMVDLEPKKIKEKQAEEPEPLPVIKPITTQLAHVSTDAYNTRPDPKSPGAPEDTIP